MTSLPLFARALPRRLALLTAAASAVLLAACSTSQPQPSSSSTPKTAAATAPSSSGNPITQLAPNTAAANATAGSAAIDYRQPETWLCRPGRQDVCALPLSVTTITTDGQRQKSPPIVANANAPIDCFYVYQTVSNDPTGNSDMKAGPEEIGVTFSQFSPLRTQCRLYAPLYRQVTLAALRSRFTGTPLPTDPLMAYNDVVAAWKHYLAHDNQGRGVVLIGHSQGARMLTELLAKEIEGQPVQRQLVSIYPIGSNLLVPAGQDVGGQLKSTPLCRSASQTGCAVSFVSFRATVPPPANSLFAKAPAGQAAACNQPAALAGGSTRPRAWFSRGADVNVAAGQGSARWQALVKSIDTPFFTVPGLVSTQCVSNANGSYLEVKTHPDARVDDFAGDVIASGMVLDTWGLHLVDVNLVLGDIIDLVGQQARAYLARGR